MMTGRLMGAIYPTIARASGPEVLRVEGLARRGVAGASFAIRAGEVTGFAGLVGSGKSRVWRAVMGLNRTLGGRVALNGKDMTGARTDAIIAAGMHYLPPDRKNEGLVLAASASDNIALGMLGTRQACAAGAPPRRSRRSPGRVGLDRHMLRRLVSQLSGGNQQKVLFGKGFGRDYAIYVFDEPTVGVDMGTRAQLYRVIKSLAESGKAVVVISSDLQEAMSLSHRLLVFSAGQISAELEGDEINEAAVLPHFFERKKGRRVSAGTTRLRPRHLRAGYAAKLLVRARGRAAVLSRRRPRGLHARLVAISDRRRTSSMSRDSRSIWCSCRWVR